MKQFNTSKIKNITLAGHNGSGKTSLAEAILFKGGASERLGKTIDGTTICDYDAEEIKRQYSINTTLASFVYNDSKINLIDTPGLLDFAGGMYEGIEAAETVMITVSAKSSVRTGTIKAYELSQARAKSKMFVVTKIDDPNANFYNTLTDLKTVFGPTVCPIIVPVIQNGTVGSFINLLDMKAYEYDDKGNRKEIAMPTAEISEKIEYRLEGLVAAISEAVAETDEALMEKFFEGEKFTSQEIINGIHKGIESGIITPVVCASSFNLSGIDLLLEQLELLLPASGEVKCKEALNKSGNKVDVRCSANEPLSAYVFKTIADPFVGKLSYIKVMSGKIKANTDYVNASSGQPERIGKIYNVCGKRQEEISEASAGDIVAASKITSGTSDTICESSRLITFESIEFPKACYALAVKARAQGDESKISSGIQKLLEEDRTLKYELNATTNEQLISGLGEQHIEIAVAKLKGKFGVDVELTIPKIAYKETIRRKVKVEGKHKKQTGGHGQFGHVWIEFEPCVSDELIFEDKVFGGAVPKNYFPAVEKGLQECVKSGILAGYPVVGIKAILVDGSYHPVDSSEMAFKMAASIAYREGLKKSDPVLLEPIGSLAVKIPDENTGDLMGELNKRRGRVLGMNPTEKKGETEIVAEVPMREMQDFTMYVRRVTKGMGEFTFEFLRYEMLPANLTAEVVSESDNDIAAEIA